MPLDEILLIGENEPFEGAPSEETDPCCSGMVDPARKFLFSGLPSFGGSESESEVAQSYLTLCDPMDCSLPGSSIHGILQARVLEWVAVSFSRVSSQTRDRALLSEPPGKPPCLLQYRITHRFFHRAVGTGRGGSGRCIYATWWRKGDCSLEPKIFATASLLGKTTTLLLGLFRASPQFHLPLISNTLRPRIFDSYPGAAPPIYCCLINPPKASHIKQPPSVTH